MSRFLPNPHYFLAGCAALVLAVVTGWCGWSWTPAMGICSLFIAAAAVALFLWSRPTIEIRDSHLMVGRHAIPWSEIRRVDKTGWVSPLVVHLTLTGNRETYLIHPGNLGNSNVLLRLIRRNARFALLDGVPYRDFWGEPAQGDGQPAPVATPPSRTESAPPRFQLLRKEDEDDVERMFHRLKSVGNLDSKASSDEK